MVSNQIKQISTEQNTHSDHRYDIDGLRGIAVLAVVLNHLNDKIFPGGYLGVDIFFVISGFVITSSINKRQDQSFFAFSYQFYARRFRRLVPALIFFVIPTSILVLLFNPQPAVDLSTGASSVIGYSNIYLFRRSTDYFASTSQLNPFLQTWSLGIEEQFYLLFPFLLWGSGLADPRRRDGSLMRTAILLLPLCIASFISFASSYNNSFSAAYFLPTCRFWELATGCLLFIAFQKTRKNEMLRKSREWIFTLILISCFFIYACILFNQDIYHYVAHLLVVSITSIIIFALARCTLVSHILSSKLLVYLGAISYSLYLWHWGIISIAKNTIGINQTSLPAVLLFIVAMSHFSYSYIETPWRKSKTYSALRTNLTSIITLISLFAVIKKIALSEEVSLAAYRGENRENQVSTKIQNTVIGDKLHWFHFPANNDPVDSSAVATPKHHEKPKVSSKRIVFVGDSHTSHLLPAIIILGKNLQREVSIAVISRAGTKFPTANWTKVNVMTRQILQERSAETNRDFFQALKSLSKGDLIIISNNMHELLLPSNNSSITYWDANWEEQITPAEALAQWGEKLKLLKEELKVKGIDLAVVAPTPNFKNKGTGFVMEHLCYPEWFRVSIPDGCPSKFDPINYSDLKEEISYFTNLVLYKAYIDKLMIFKTDHLFCNQKNCNPVDTTGESLFIDTNHLSMKGAQLIAPELIAFTKLVLRESHRKYQF